MLPPASSPAMERAPAERVPLVHIAEGIRCFCCGPEAKHGLGVQFYHAGDHVEAHWVANDVAEGWSGLLHGSAFAALHDDAAAWAMITLAGQSGFTTRMDVKFLKPLRIGDALHIAGKPLQVGPRSGAFHSEIRWPDGSLASTATTEFAFVDAATIARLMGRPPSPRLAEWLALPVEERKVRVLEFARHERVARNRKS